MRVNAERPSPLGEEFWSSRDVREPHNPPLWIRAIWAKQQPFSHAEFWMLRWRLRPRGWHQTGYDFQRGEW